MADPYRPNLPADLWEHLGPFVTAIIDDAAGLTAYNDRELYAAVTPLAVWMHTHAGLDLDRDTALDPYTIDQFVVQGLPYYTKAGQGTMRSRLRRLSEVLIPELGETAKERALGKSQRLSPYTDTEQTNYRSWARALPDGIRENANRLLSLGFGAGLQGSEISNLRTRDITVTADGVTIRVTGERRRNVPVLAEWAQPLIRHVNNAEPGSYAFRLGRQKAHRNAVTHFSEKHGPRVPVQARRMRATWIVRQLSAGTPITVLLPAAGFASAEALDPFLQWATTPSDGDRLLRLACGDD